MIPSESTGTKPAQLVVTTAAKKPLRLAYEVYGNASPLEIVSRNGADRSLAGGPDNPHRITVDDALRSTSRFLRGIN